MFGRGLNVEVGAHCFSSCANYVFPAGKRKILRRHSLLGWHGGALQPMQFDDPKMQAGYEAYVTQARQREAAYFQKIGVQQQSTVYGQRDEFKAHADCVGWDYSPAAMAALGMRRIELAEAQRDAVRAATNHGVLVMTGGQFGTDVIATQFYNQYFVNRNAGLGSAIAIILLAAVMPVIIYNIRHFNKNEPL